MPGRMDEVKGTLKKAAGKATGNERLSAEGETQRATGKAARETKGASEQVAGNVKMGAGKMIGNKRLHTEGKTQDAKGSLRRVG